MAPRFRQFSATVLIALLPLVIEHFMPVGWTDTSTAYLAPRAKPVVKEGF